ncbi:MAG: Multidrug resistance protein MdtA [Chlamydiales bacterium]|nr:Multidrug resistance protein MdtA [Chlamydiales bacterium]
MRFFLLCTLLLGACSQQGRVQESVEEASITVDVFDIEPETLLETVLVLGEIKPNQSVTVYPKTHGKLQSYQVKKGQSIQKGDCLATMDRDEVGYQYNQVPVYAPLAGVISSLPLSSGCVVNPQTVVGEVMQIDTVTARFSVPDQYREKMREGQAITVRVGSSAYAATLKPIVPLIDPATRTFVVEASLDNPSHALLPGMFAKATIVLNEVHQSILIPEEAVIAMGGRWHVYKMENGSAVLEEVKLGLRKEGRIQITEGLSAHEQVITRGSHKVSEGQKVRRAL